MGFKYEGDHPPAGELAASADLTAAADLALPAALQQVASNSVRLERMELELCGMGAAVLALQAETTGIRATVAQLAKEVAAVSGEAAWAVLALRGLIAGLDERIERLEHSSGRIEREADRLALMNADLIDLAQRLAGLRPPAP